MKRVIAICLLVLMASTLWAEWLEPILIMKGGWYPDGRVTASFDPAGLQEYEVLPANGMEFDVTFGATLFGFLWAEGQVITMSGVIDGNPWGGMFSPYQSDYGFRAGISRWGIRLGYEHWCYHPVGVYGETRLETYGGSDSFFVEFDLQRMLGERSRYKNAKDYDWTYW